MTVAELARLVDEQYNDKVKALIGIEQRNMIGLTLVKVSYVALNGQECLLMEFETQGDFIKGFGLHRLKDSMPSILDKVPLTDNVKVTIDDEPAMWMSYRTDSLEGISTLICELVELEHLKNDGIPHEVLVNMFMTDGSPVYAFEQFKESFGLKEDSNGQD